MRTLYFAQLSPKIKEFSRTCPPHPACSIIFGVHAQPRRRIPAQRILKRRVSPQDSAFDTRTRTGLPTPYWSLAALSKTGSHQ
jgi:hypothetical protein